MFLSWDSSRPCSRQQKDKAQASPAPGPGRLGEAGASEGQRVPLSLQRLLACDPRMSVQWQVVDRRIPLYANLKTILKEAAALYEAHY